MENPNKELELAQLTGDDVTHTDPAHFAEFASVEQHAAELEGEQVNLNQAPFSTQLGDNPAPTPEIPTTDLIRPLWRWPVGSFVQRGK